MISHVIETGLGPVQFWECEFQCTHSDRDVCSYCGGFLEPETERFMRYLKGISDIETQIVFIAECWTCHVTERFDDENSRNIWTNTFHRDDNFHDVELYRQMWPSSV